MESNKITIILIISIILVIVLGGAFIYIIIQDHTNNDIESKNTISDNINNNVAKIQVDVNNRDDIIKLIEYGNSYNNLYSEASSQTKYTGIDDVVTDNRIEKYKDNIFTIEKDKTFIWINKNTNEMISLNHDTKIALKQDGTTYGKLIEKHNNSILLILENNTYTYKYIKNEQYNNNDCIVFEMINNNNSLIVDCWIDTSTGLIMKQEQKKFIMNEETENIITEWEVSIDTVTDNDIKEPDVSGYDFSERTW